MRISVYAFSGAMLLSVDVSHDVGAILNITPVIRIHFLLNASYLATYPCQQQNRVI